jgi:hypothetical protein
VSFDEFLAVLDAGVDVNLLILPPLLHEHEHHDPHHHPELQPLEMAEAFYQRVCDSVSAKGNGGGGGELMGVMGFCAEVEVLATSTVGLRGQSLYQQTRMSESAITIQRAHRSSMQLKRTRCETCYLPAQHPPLAYCYICVLVLLYMCPHNAIFVSSCYYICVHILLYLWPYTTIFVCSCCYIYMVLAVWVSLPGKSCL